MSFMFPAWRVIFTASGPTSNSVVVASSGLLTMASTSIFLPLFSQLTCHLIVSSLTNPLEIWHLYDSFIMSNRSVQPRFILPRLWHQLWRLFHRLQLLKTRIVLRTLGFLLLMTLLSLPPQVHQCHLLCPLLILAASLVVWIHYLALLNDCYHLLLLRLP